MPPRKYENRCSEDASATTKKIYNRVLKFARANNLRWDSKKAEGVAFEEYTKEVLIANGFTLYSGESEKIKQFLKGSNDYGVDLVMYYDLNLSAFDSDYLDDYSTEDGWRVAIQCKFYTANPVESKHVRDLGGSLGYFNCTAGFLITSSSFTPDAIKFAKGTRNKLHLIDGKTFLDKYIAKYEKKLKAMQDEDDDDETSGWGLWARDL